MDRTPDTLSASKAMPNASRRRDKPQLSCNLCRRRKLKCDRGLPCQSCVHRGLSLSCTYVPSNAPEGVQRTQRHPNASADFQDRIDQLEQLVNSMISSADAPLRSGQGPEDSAPLIMLSVNDQKSDANYQLKGLSRFSDGLGQLSLESTETRYVESIHWTAILDGVQPSFRITFPEGTNPRDLQITELKGYFRDESAVEPPDFSSTPESIEEPDMLFGSHKRTNKQEILAGLPPRESVDRLVAMYFHKRAVAPPIVHSPTFLKEYERFWEQPLETPVMWLGLLFTVISLAALYNNQPGPLQSDPKSLIPAFRDKIIQCLLLGRYTRCGPYTMETLLLYFHVEYLRSEDTQIETWILLGVIIRLALRTGYHRDPCNITHISAFQGEMRRRAWAVIVQWDILGSAEIGLPRTIRDSHTDTAEPSNFLDEDFDEDIALLPPSRPNDFQSPIQYSVARNRIIMVYGQISDLITSTKQAPYQEVIQLDQRLDNTYASLPDGLLHRAMAKSLLDTPEVIMRRIYIALLVLKAKCVLHYRYMLPARTDSHYRPSQSTCIESALQVLEIQKLLNQEIRPGGRLYQHSISYFVKSSFYLATTLLSLKLNSDITAEDEVSASSSETDTVDIRQRVVHALQESYFIWIQSSSSSPEARKAAAVLSVVLGKAQRMSSRRPIQTETASNITLAGSSSQSMSPMGLSSLTWELFAPIGQFPSSQCCSVVVPNGFSESSFSPSDTPSPPRGLSTPTSFHQLLQANLDSEINAQPVHPIPKKVFSTPPSQRNTSAPKHQHHLASIGNTIDYSDLADVSDPFDLVSKPS